MPLLIVMLISLNSILKSSKTSGCTFLNNSDFSIFLKFIFYFLYFLIESLEWHFCILLKYFIYLPFSSSKQKELWMVNNRYV
jgi:hypothetical protein